MTVRVTSILGNASDPPFADRLHALRHADRVEYVRIGAQDLARRRIRIRTDRGTECAIGLARDDRLEHGAVLELTDERAIVVELESLPWLELEPADRPSALELGFLAGHHHWRVEFAGNRLRVALDQPREAYLKRLEKILGAGGARVVEPADE